MRKFITTILLIPAITIFSQTKNSTMIADSIFLPLSVGNTWQYLRKTIDSDGPSYGLSFRTVEDDTIIGNFSYYTISELTGLIRYSKNDKKMYVRWNDSDYVYIDFTKPDGAIYQAFYGGGYMTVYAEAGEHNIFNLSRAYGGYLHISGYSGYMVWYTDSIGMSYDRSADNYIDESRNLIEAVIYDSLGSEIQFTNNHKPIFEISPITTINSSEFILPFKVTHYYTRLISPNQPPWHSGLDFIKNVKMLSYYSKNDSVIFNQSIFPLHSSNPVNVDYLISIQFDTTLMKDGFAFNYKFTAEDKGLIPENSSSPDSGYYTCVWDNTTNLELFNNNSPAEFSLSQNYPNPFNPTTTIKFTIPTSPQSPPYQGGEAKQGWFVQLKVYDVLGNEIATLVNEEKPAGTYEVEFNPASGIRNPASGIYFYQLKAGNFIETKKMILLK